MILDGLPEDTADLAIRWERATWRCRPPMPRCGWCTWAGIFRWATTTRRWRRFRPAAADGAVEPDQAFAALAARRLILAETQRQRGALGQVETLDELHAVAIEEGIVTPYSSMIVLVNVRQERLLDELEAQGDRFAREFEEVGETAPESALMVTAAPEPHEWLLIAVAVGMLVWYARAFLCVLDISLANSKVRVSTTIASRSSCRRQPNAWWYIRPPGRTCTKLPRSAYPPVTTSWAICGANERIGEDGACRCW